MDCSNSIGPLLTASVNDSLLAARRAGRATLDCSLDLGRSTVTIDLRPEEWTFAGRPYAYLDSCKPRTIYHWSAARFEPLARFAGSLTKLVPTEWGTPTFEIDGIKMLASERASPWTDAARKVALIHPRGKVILDTCGGLGYFAAFCLGGRCAQVYSYEKNADVIWLRSLNPWSPDLQHGTAGAMMLTNGDVTERVGRHESGSIDAVLHDPPRFAIAGELYSLAFYRQLARVLKRGGRMFHYTGTPNKLSRGRDLAHEVAARLRSAGFAVEPCIDGVLAVKRAAQPLC